MPTAPQQCGNVLKVICCPLLPSNVALFRGVPPLHGSVAMYKRRSTAHYSNVAVY